MPNNSNTPPVQDEELGNVGVRGNGLPLTHQSDATGINAAATVRRTMPATSNTAAATLAAGTNQDARMLEQFDDDVGPYRPTLGDSDDEDQILKGKGHVEEIKDNANPDHELSHLTDGNTNETKKMAAAPAKLEIIDDDGFPVNPTEFEDDIDVKMRAKASNDQTAVRSDEESILVPTNEEIEGEAEVVTRGVNDIRNRGNRQPHRPSVNVGGIENNANEGHSINRESSVPVIPEAFLVQESDIVVATPTVPWWKQRRTRFLLCLVFVVVTVLSVALGAAFSSREQSPSEVRTEFVALTSSPSISTGPTIHPTTGRPSLIPSSNPSSSQVPSSSPSACSDIIISNMQTFNLPRPDLRYPRVAIDGRNMIVLSSFVKETFGAYTYNTGSLYIEFYSHNNDDGKWELVGYLIEADLEWEMGFHSYDVSLSGETAVVGVPDIQVVYVFQRDMYGLWAKVDTLKPSTKKLSGPCGFGQSVDVDEDLLIVVDSYDCYCWGCGNAEVPNSIHVFIRNANKWEELDVLMKTIDWSSWELDRIFDASVKGGVVAVAEGIVTEGIEGYYDVGGADFIYLYEIHYKNESLTLIQRIESLKYIRAVEALGSHLIYTTDDGVFIFYRTDPSQEFTYLQQLNRSNYGGSSTIAMDKGILVIGGGSTTHFFAEQDDGVFEETMVLDQKYNFQISGRTLVATNSTEVHILDIASCTQEVPTQTPTLSMAPTICYPVYFTFIEGQNGFEWEATVQKVETTGVITMQSYSYEEKEGWSQNTYRDSLCLNEGRYQFSIRGLGKFMDSGFNYVYEELLAVQYTVRSEDRLIAQGGSPDENVEIPERSVIEVHHNIVFDMPSDQLTVNLPASSPQPARPTTLYPTLSAEVCLDQSECSDQLEKKGLESFHVGDYPDYGCFMKGDKLYWGIGGTNEQMAIDPLSGAKERVWC